MLLECRHKTWFYLPDNYITKPHHKNTQFLVSKIRYTSAWNSWFYIHTSGSFSKYFLHELYRLEKVEMWQKICFLQIFLHFKFIWGRHTNNEFVSRYWSDTVILHIYLSVQIMSKAVIRNKQGMNKGYE